MLISYWPGKRHPLIQNVGCVNDVPRVHTKLKLVTGVYALQNNYKEGLGSAKITQPIQTTKRKRKPLGTKTTQL